MNKKKFYLISVLLITVIFFSSAVTCNFCGTPIEVITPDEETTEDGPEVDQQSQGSSATADDQSSPSTSDDTGGEEETENEPPKIIKIELAGTDIDIYIEEGMLDEVTISSEDDPVILHLLITAEDNEGDELEYRAYDSMDNEFEVTKLDNNNAEFYWPVPSSLGPYTLTMEVSDEKGGNTVRSVDMNIVLETLEFIPPETEESSDADDGEAIGESLRSFGAIASLTGQVNDDGEVFLASESSGAPAIFAGDTADNVLVKGFISFDVSDITGVEVLAAWLTLSGSWIGNPGNFRSSFSVGHLDYGNTLDPEDFDLEDDGLGGGPSGFRDFSFSNEYLKDAVQSTVDEERQYFQLMLSHSMTNNNDVSDGYSFLLSDIQLEVSYR